VAIHFNKGVPINRNNPNDPTIKRVDRNRPINPNIFNPNPQTIRTDNVTGRIPLGQPEKKYKVTHDPNI